MKKRNLLAVSLLVLPMGSLLSSCAIADIINCSGKEKIRIFNWGNYIDPAVIKSFEKEEKVCVSYSKFESNEMAISKMAVGTYDVIFPSDYAIEQLAQEDKILPLDWTKITNFDKEEDLAPNLSILFNKMRSDSNPFDFLEYAAPYMTGYVGIIYNNKLPGIEAEIEAKGWEILLESKYRVAYYDSARDGFVPPLSQLGYNINTTSAAEINEAKDWLINQKNKLGNNITYLTDEVLDDMISKRYDLGLVYSGDAIYIMQEQEDMSFYRPEDKATNVFVDGMVIQKGSKKIDLAYKFINFMLSYENALLNSQFIGYTSTRKDVYDYLSEDDFTDFKEIYAFPINDLDEVFRYSESAKTLLDSAWDVIRSS